MEDPFLLTEMPRLVFDETWFPNISNEYSPEENSGLSDEQMATIAQSNITEHLTLWRRNSRHEHGFYMSGASLKLTLKIRRHDQWPLFANFLLDSLSEDLLLQSVSLKANSVGILFPFLTFQYCGFIFCSMMSQLPTSL